MNLLPYKVATSINTDGYYHTTELGELRKWLQANVGTAYQEWSTFIDYRNNVGVNLRTKEQATIVALRWA